MNLVASVRQYTKMSDMGTYYFKMTFTSYLTWVINEPFFDRLVLCITGCPAIQSDICYLVKFCDSYFWYLPFLVFMNVYIVCWLEELLKFLMLHDKFAFTPTRFWRSDTFIDE